MSVIAVAALARPTFDVALAESVAAQAFATLDASGHNIVGSRALLMDADATKVAIDALKDAGADLMLIFQVSFTDASMTVEIADQIGVPLAIWAFPEPRTGERLRLNSFCGLNLAAHALGRAGITPATHFGPPDDKGIAAFLNGALSGEPAHAVSTLPVTATDVADVEKAANVLSSLKGARIGLVGEHPAGFDTCRYDTQALDQLSGISVEPITLDTLFEGARAADPGRISMTREKTATMVSGLDSVDQEQLDRSFRVHASLEDIAINKNLNGIAVRCWPELFTEYGCAACGPMSMMNEAKIPCACEADVNGALTSLMLQQTAEAPAFLADIVDMDDETDTGVLWHCGLAPTSMASARTPPKADLHSNRKMPLLNAFALKSGRVTLARISEARNTMRLVIGGGEMIEAPMSYSGTSGVIRFDTPVADVRARLLGEALEHHVAIVYGDHRGTLAALGERLGLPVFLLS